MDDRLPVRCGDRAPEPRRELLPPADKGLVDDPERRCPSVDLVLDPGTARPVEAVVERHRVQRRQHAGHGPRPRPDDVGGQIVDSVEDRFGGVTGDEAHRKLVGVAIVEGKHLRHPDTRRAVQHLEEASLAEHVVPPKRRPPGRSCLDDHPVRPFTVERSQ